MFSLVRLPALIAAAGLLCTAVPAEEVRVDHDGPYVIWHDSARATVFCLCQDELVSEAYEVGDTLYLRDLCDLLAVTVPVPSRPPEVEPFEYSGVTRILAISDLHGQYEATVDFLKVAGVVDDSLRWSWGDGHLVVNGDIFDRGDGVTDLLWLVYRLEQEALRAGGRVHFTLGNHEKMVVRGDNRYVHEKYLDGTARKSRILHQDLFGPDTELGRWVRTRHTAIKLNDILFVHAGISVQLMERGWDIETINRKVRQYLDLPSTQVAFSDEPKFLFGSLGPLWYRGLFESREGVYDQLTQSEVRAILACFGAGTMVVGHTLMDQVDSYYGGLVFEVGVPLDGPGTMQGLLWEDGHFYRVTASGQQEELR